MLGVKRVLAAILSRMNAVSDYVIDEGSSDGWYYRKWNSGKYECWKYLWGTASTGFTAWGSLYYVDIAGPKFPITFVSAPICIITPHGSQAYILGCYSITTSAIGEIRFGHNGTGAVAAYANIYVYGFWK